MLVLLSSREENLAHHREAGVAFSWRYIRLQEAGGNHLTHAEFLELILQDELLVRKERQIARRVKSAAFRDLKSLEEFDWSFNPAIKKSDVYDLATGRFIEQHRDVLFCAPPGTGKSHTSRGWGIN